MTAPNEHALYSDLLTGTRAARDLSQQEAAVAAPIIVQEDAYTDPRHPSHAHAVKMARELYARAYPESES